MTKTKGKQDASKPDHRRTSIGNSTIPRMTKETASFIEKLAEKDSTRKKKKKPKKTDPPEDGIVRRLAKQGLIDKTKAKGARNSTKKTSRGSSVSSTSCCDSSSTSSDSSIDSDDSSNSSDDKKKKSKKKEPEEGDGDDKLTAEAKSKTRKENKRQKLPQSDEEAQNLMLDMATELRELRGLPEAIQKQLEEQQKAAAGKDEEKDAPQSDYDVSMESPTRV